MAYEAHEWKTGELITAERLNALEQGAAQAAQPGPAGKGIKSIALTADADGKVTGGTVTFSDDTTGAIAVTTV